MKSEFSTSWMSSSKPRKQRKFQANAPFHIRHKFLSAHLSKELRKRHNKRSMPVRKGDEVLVMRGSFKKKKVKITSVDTRRTRVVLEGIQRQKKDGTKVNVYFHPSALQITALNLDDRKRVKVLDRKSKVKTQEKTNA